MDGFADMTAVEKLGFYEDVSRRFGLYGPPLSFDLSPKWMSCGELPDAWSQGDVASISAQIQSVYVHIPFCRAPRCSYCMYKSDTRFLPNTIEQYLSAVESEWSLWRRLIHCPLRNLYIGGGTPSLLSPGQLRRLLRMFMGMSFQEDGERTCEMSPATALVEHVEAVADGGLNRLSLGVQSYDDEVLSAVGRSSRGLDRIPEIVAAARNRAFVDVNLDLMLGLRGVSAENVSESVARAVASGALSVSLYYYRPIVALPDDTVHRRMRTMRNHLHAAISVFERHGWAYVAGDDTTEYHLFYSPERSRQTLRYKTTPSCRDNYEVIGLGSYAHGFRPSCLYERENILHAGSGAYLRYSSVEQQRRIAACNMLYSSGGTLDFKEFNDAFGVSALECFKDEIDDLLSLRKAECDGTRLVLRPCVSDEMFALQKFFWDQRFLSEVWKRGPQCEK